jgi:uncharacterized protein (DUF2141 family)
MRNLLLAALLFSALCPGAVQAQDACAVTLVAKGVKDSKGKVGFLMFASPSGWPHGHEQAYRDDAKPARPGDVEMRFTGIKPGNYAFVALHDENENKKLDRKGSGRPTEGWAMSRNPKGKMKTPPFQSAVMMVQCGSRIEMTMQYPAKGEE